MKKKPALAAVPAAAKKKAATPAAAVAKKKPAAAVSATAKKQPTTAVPAAKKKATAAVPVAKNTPTSAAVPPAVASAAVIPVAKKRPSCETAGCGPRKRAREDDSGDADLISNLPDAILGTIVSLLPTKDGARTQAIARRWRPLWRSAPLNLDAHNLSNIDSDYCPLLLRRGPRRQTNSIISRILSDHPGPVRRFDFRLICIYPTKKECAQIESWLHSPSLDNLQELHIFFPILIGPAHARKIYRLPSSVLRFASTVVMLTIGHCDFPNEIAPSLNFPLLKHLTLRRVSISEDIFHGVLSACHVLETLFLEENVYMALLHISSPTLRSISFRDCVVQEGELVIEDTPHLERLLCIDFHCETIRVNRAPKLEILGRLSPRNSNIQIGSLVFQKLIPTSLNHSICTVKVLALQFSYTDLGAVLDILRFFPCLEKLYVMWDKNFMAKMKSVHQYDPLDPIICLENHVKVLVLKNYEGVEEHVGFAKFFVLNAKELNEIKFRVCENIDIDEKWVANQHRLLGVESKASADAQFKFMRGSSDLDVELDTHDLSIADPFHSIFCRG